MKTKINILQSKEIEVEFPLYVKNYNDSLSLIINEKSEISFNSALGFKHEMFTCISEKTLKRITNKDIFIEKIQKNIDFLNRLKSDIEENKL